VQKIAGRPRASAAGAGPLSASAWSDSGRTAGGFQIESSEKNVASVESFDRQTSSPVRQSLSDVIIVATKKKRKKIVEIHHFVFSRMGVMCFPAKRTAGPDRSVDPPHPA
jgi:hypothetical protein